MSKNIQKSSNWYCELLKIDHKTFRNILKYLGIYEENKKQYPINIIPSVKKFITEHPSGSRFFQQLTTEEHKKEIREKLKKAGFHVVKDLPDQLGVKYEYLIVLMARNSIKVRKKCHVGYITDEDFSLLKKVATEYEMQEHKLRSIPQKEVVEYIKSIYNGDIIENYRQLIAPREVDIYIPSAKVAIEFNGTF